MSTLGTMITSIAEDLGRSDLSGANGAIETKIREAIAQYQPQSFFFNNNDQITFNTVVGQERYTDADTMTVEYTDWYDLRTVFLEEASGRVHELLPMSYMGIRLLTDTASSSSRPTHYCRYGESIYVYPKPDLATYQLNPVGHYKIAAPATSGEADNPWMTLGGGWDLIKHGATRRLYMDRIKNQQMAQSQGLLEMAALEQLSDQTVKKTRTSRIRSTTF